MSEFCVVNGLLTAQQSDADVTHVQSSVSVSKPKDSVDRATLLTGVVLVFVCGVVVVMVMSKCSPFDCQFTASTSQRHLCIYLSIYLSIYYLHVRMYGLWKVLEIPRI